MVNQYRKPNLKLCWQLAGPHTWPASIFPVLLALAFAFASNHSISVASSIILLLIAILCQSAVNAFNDYFDYVKGIDTKDDNVEVDDSVLVYNDINPKAALMLAIGLLSAALILGIYCIWIAGWAPLAVAFIGAAAIVLYSGGKTPISFLPIGEIVSGFVMGALITFASYIVFTKSINWFVLVWSIPLVIGIGLIMMTNNTCDIEKDAVNSRHTLPVMLGRKRSLTLYRSLIALWCISIIVIAALWFRPGLLIVPFMLLATYAPMKAILTNSLKPESRIAAMSQICTLNIALNAFYACIVLGSTLSITV